MAIYFDDSGSDAFNPADWGVSTKPAKRGVLGAANDYVINAANLILGGTKSITRNLRFTSKTHSY